MNALADAAREETYSGVARARIDGKAPGVVQRVRDGGGVVLGGIFATVFAFIAGLVAWAKRPRKCPRGHGRMTLLSETQDDRELSNEEVLEEHLRSMNYDVWICGQCPERIIVPHSRWFSSYRQCPECRRKTLKVTRMTITAATYSTSGLARESRRCKNCSYANTRDIVLPMLTRSSSSGGGGFSSGGGSSFGGGSSGGGGAGRSY